MEQLILVTSNDSYECSCDVLIAIRYKSKDDLLLDLECKVEEWVENFNTHDLAISEYEAKRNKLMKSLQQLKSGNAKQLAKNDQQYQEYIKFLDTRPEIDYNISIANKTLPISFFAYPIQYSVQCNTNTKPQFIKPTIMTLNEWFEGQASINNYKS